MCIPSSNEVRHEQKWNPVETRRERVPPCQLDTVFGKGDEFVINLPNGEVQSTKLRVLGRIRNFIKMSADLLV